MNDNLGTGHKVLKREIVVTADGSTSLKIPELDGKKIGWKDGVRAIYAVLKYNIWRRN